MKTRTEDQHRSTLFVCLVAGIAALAGLLFGYDTGVISGAILFIKQQFLLTPGREEMVVSAVLLGAVIGASVSGGVADYFGRRRSIIVTAVLFLFGAVGSSLAPSIVVLVSCRVLIGLAIGVASFVAPLYISEIAPPHMRGGLVSLNQLMITIGIMVAYVVDDAFSGGASWRWMFGLGAVPAMVLMVGMIFLPPSPRWLVSRKDLDKARAVLSRVRGGGDVEEELRAVQGTMDQEAGGWSELFRPWVRPVLFVGVALAFFQQATGINTVIYYAPTIFEFAGFGSAKQAIGATTIVGTVNVLMTVVAVWLLDRVGRRPLLLAGLAGMVVSLGVLGAAFHFSKFSDALKWIAVGSLICYIASFAVSLGPIFWLIIAEIYPLRIRGRAMSLATVANWVFNFLVAMTFLTITDTLGKAGAFWLYAGIAIAGFVFCYVFIPETKGRTLEEIEEHLRSGRSLRSLGS
ncbi:MAG: sugar porter family MFS transporter [Planctomycetes bacterium]|nr:sugar porter family MFS transporter [Planctomycetota bacterium]